MGEKLWKKKHHEKCRSNNQTIVEWTLQKWTYFRSRQDLILVNQIRLIHGADFISYCSSFRELFVLKRARNNRSKGKHKNTGRNTK